VFIYVKQILICNSRPIAEIVTKLQPLFKMDIYLPRSIVACMHVTELEKFLKEPWVPIEVACATVLYWIKITRASYPQYKLEGVSWLSVLAYILENDELKYKGIGF